MGKRREHLSSNWLACLSAEPWAFFLCLSLCQSFMAAYKERNCIFSSCQAKNPTLVFTVQWWQMHGLCSECSGKCKNMSSCCECSHGDLLVWFFRSWIGKHNPPRIPSSRPPCRTGQLLCSNADRNGAWWVFKKKKSSISEAKPSALQLFCTDASKRQNCTDERRKADVKQAQLNKQTFLQCENNLIFQPSKQVIQANLLKKAPAPPSMAVCLLYSS